MCSKLMHSEQHIMNNPMVLKRENFFIKAWSVMWERSSLPYIASSSTRQHTLQWQYITAHARCVVYTQRLYTYSTQGYECMSSEDMNISAVAVPFKKPLSQLMSLKNHRTYAQHYGMAQVANICTSRLTHIHNVT